MTEPLIFDTPAGVQFVRLAALASALKGQVRGVNVVGHGSSATKVGKRDYGLTGQAKTMLRVVEPVVEAHHLIRRWSPEALDFAVNTLDDLREACEASPDPTIVFDHEQVLRGTSIAARRGALPQDVCDLIIAVDLVRRFEEGSKPSTRIVFREALS